MNENNIANVVCVVVGVVTIGISLRGLYKDRQVAKALARKKAELKAFEENVARHSYARAQGMTDMLIARVSSKEFSIKAR